jgi:Protein of unknown function (DUF3604)
VVSSSGQAVGLSRSLDFPAVADHAQALGSTEEVKKGNPNLMTDPTLRRWHDLMTAGGDSASQGRSKSFARPGSARCQKRRFLLQRQACSESHLPSKQGHF